MSAGVRIIGDGSACLLIGDGTDPTANDVSSSPWLGPTPGTVIDRLLRRIGTTGVPSGRCATGAGRLPRSRSISSTITRPYWLDVADLRTGTASTPRLRSTSLSMKASVLGSPST